MTQPTVPEVPPNFGNVAADLRRVADLFDQLWHVELREQPYIRLNIQVGGTDDEVIERTDAVGMVLTGRPGTAQLMSARDHTYHYDTESKVGLVAVHLYNSISEDTVRTRQAAKLLADKEAELERLRAEVAKLRDLRDDAYPAFGSPAAAERFRRKVADEEREALAYERDTADGSQPGPRREPHVGAVVDGGELVDETPAEPQMAADAPIVLVSARTYRHTAVGMPNGSWLCRCGRQGRDCDDLAAVHKRSAKVMPSVTAAGTFADVLFEAYAEHGLVNETPVVPGYSGNVADDDEESLVFADESEYADDGSDEAEAPAEPYEPQPGEIVFVERWADTQFRVGRVADGMAEVFSRSGSLSGWVPFAEVRPVAEPVSEAR